MSETASQDAARDFVLPLGAGVVQLVAAGVMLTAGAPAAWSWITLACGTALVLGAWMICVEPPAELRRTVLAAAGIATALLAVGLVYLTHRADDLPGVLPGHDGDSQHYRVVEGMASLALAGATWAALLPRALRRH